MSLAIKVILLLIGVIYNTKLAFEFKARRLRLILSLATASLLFGLAVYLLAQQYEWVAEIF
jgi:hypothetical protein